MKKKTELVNFKPDKLGKKLDGYSLRGKFMAA